MNSPPLICRYYLRLAPALTSLAVALVLLFNSHVLLAAYRFPQYDAIQPNITFWERIYSLYSLDQAVIHDSEDLSRIYEVIRLRSHKLRGAQAHNSKLQNQAKKKYRTILKNLSRRAPKSPEEKRIAGLFKGKHKQRQMAKAADNLRSQTGQRERFRQGVKTSGAYIKEIKRIFRSYRLPEDLSYLPHVESSFNTRAYSKFGAAGIWQFTRGTGKTYLKIDYVVDERLDPILATHAAAKYLKKSYRSLGQWPLAVTSYNYGLSGMLRAQKELKTYPKIFQKYNKGHFKFASKNFYPEFLAALRVAKRLEKQIKLAPAQSQRKLKLPGFVSIDNIAGHFNTDRQTMKRLNPALRPPVFNGEKLLPKGYSLRLPARKSTDTLIATLPSSLFKNTQKASLYHRVKRGETAGTIARLHRVSLKSLMKTNNLDKYATIYIRQKLRIPKKTITGNTSRKKQTHPKAGESNSLPIFSEIKKNRPLDPGVDFFPEKDPTVYNVLDLHRTNGLPVGTITVQPEETMRLFTEWLATSRDTLLQLNGLSQSSPLSPGQKLLVPFDKIKPDVFEEKRLDFLQETEEDFFLAYTVAGQTMYTVSAGDTLWDLCHNKFDIPLWLLERYNSTIDLAQLWKDQELVIPIVKQL